MRRDSDTPGESDPAAGLGGAASGQSDDLPEPSFAEAFASLVTSADAAPFLLPQEGRSEVLTLIVRTAARVLSARAASLFLLDEAGEQLVFEVAIGPKADAVRQFSVQVGHGIAGTVAATGQPMAISAPEQDAHFAAEIAQSVSYLPQSIVCVPLRHGDRIIGVLEVLDKDGHDSFAPEDIEILADFAELAAHAAEQARRRDELRSALADVVTTWAAGTSAKGNRDTLLADLHAALADARSTSEYRAALAISDKIGAIARFGEAERALCYDWLNRLHEYLQTRTVSLPDGRSWLR